GGGIGRRVRFRSVCPRGRGGSTPPSRTNQFGMVRKRPLTLATNNSAGTPRRLGLRLDPLYGDAQPLRVEGVGGGHGRIAHAAREVGRSGTTGACCRRCRRRAGRGTG